jgi:hypothetical protein
VFQVYIGGPLAWYHHINEGSMDRAYAVAMKLGDTNIGTQVQITHNGAVVWTTNAFHFPFSEYDVKYGEGYVGSADTSADAYDVAKKFAASVENGQVDILHYAQRVWTVCAERITAC